MSTRAVCQRWAYRARRCKRRQIKWLKTTTHFGSWLRWMLQLRERWQASSVNRGRRCSAILALAMRRTKESRRGTSFTRARRRLFTTRRCRWLSRRIAAVCNQCQTHTPLPLSARANRASWAKSPPPKAPRSHATRKTTSPSRFQSDLPLKTQLSSRAMTSRPVSVLPLICKKSR